MNRLKLKLRIAQRKLVVQLLRVKLIEHEALSLQLSKLKCGFGQHLYFDPFLRLMNHCRLAVFKEQIPSNQVIPLNK